MYKFKHLTSIQFQPVQLIYHHPPFLLASQIMILSEKTTCSTLEKVTVMELTIIIQYLDLESHRRNNKIYQNNLYSIDVIQKDYSILSVFENSEAARPVIEYSCCARLTSQAHG